MLIDKPIKEDLCDTAASLTNYNYTNILSRNSCVMFFLCYIRENNEEGPIARRHIFAYSRHGISYWHVPLVFLTPKKISTSVVWWLWWRNQSIKYANCKFRKKESSLSIFFSTSSEIPRDISLYLHSHWTKSNASILILNIKILLFFFLKATFLIFLLRTTFVKNVLQLKISLSLDSLLIEYFWEMENM